MSHAMSDVRKQKKASNGVGSGELVRLTYIELRLLHSEMRTNADCCDDDAIRADYRRLAQKFRAALSKTGPNK